MKKEQKMSENLLSHPRFTVKQEIFQSNFILGLVIVTIFGCFLATVLYSSEISKARAVLNQTNHAVVLFIEGYFTNIADTISVLDENVEIRSAMGLGERTHQHILAEYMSILKANRNLKYVYSGYKNGLLLINNYAPPAGYDPTSRPWYRAAMSVKPNISIGLPYQDIKTKTWLISTSKALKQTNGSYSGVVAIDCSLTQVVHLIKQQDEYRTEFSFVMDRSGKIIMYPDRTVLGKSLKTIHGLLESDSLGDFTYDINNEKYLARSRHIDLTGWTVVTVVKRKEILRPILLQVFLLFCLTGVIAILLGFIQSAILSRRLSRPILELEKKIKATFSEDPLEDDSYIYPNNEIGTIAKEIGQLTKNEFIAKQQALQENEVKYRLLIHHAVSAVAIYKILRDGNHQPVDYIFLSANPAFEASIGLRSADILNRRVSEVIPDMKKPPFYDMYAEVIRSGKPISFEKYSESFGRYYFMNAFQMDAECFVTIFLDVTDLKKAEDKVKESENIYKTILMASPDDITIADLSGRILMVSKAANRIFGYPYGEGPGMSVMDFIVPEDHERARANIIKMINENYPGPNEYRGLRKDGSRFDIEVNNALIRDEAGNPIRMVLIVRDITNRKRAEQRIKELVHQLEIERDLAQKHSLTDSLTGLFNRRFFDNALQTEFSRYKRSGSQLSLIMLDVDHFKKYNDYYGHLNGDKCLQKIAEALKTKVKRGTDIVARYGGEEFVVILPDTNLQGATILADRLRQFVSKLGIPHAESDVSNFVTISLGIAATGEHSFTDGTQLVALADKALYYAKENGRNRFESL